MLSQFCIRRPIFASVMSILIVIAGIISASVLPIGQYPNISPPIVVVSTTYDGADAETLSRTVAAPIEDQLSGVENLLYYESTLRSNGLVRIVCTFEVGTNPNDAMLDINNRVRAAERRLPDQVRQDGVVARKRSENTLLLIPFYSPTRELNAIQLADFVNLNVVDDLKRLPGVGDVDVYGNSQSAMRIWLNPKKMAQLGITALDVEDAINQQNMQYATGKVGIPPIRDEQQISYTIRSKGQLLAPEEFSSIILRSNGADGTVKIGDVGWSDIGNRSYEAFNRYKDYDSVTVAIYLQPGANALRTAEDVKETLAEMSKEFPDNVAYVITDDNSVFVEAALEEVVRTLIEAIVLVLIVMYVFLQSWRATIVPMLAVPVSLIGTFAGLWVLNFSINTLTLFAMTLAIGIVVDDAIVVIENIERLMATEHIGPYEASQKAMKEVGSALVAIVLVLSTVFTPVAFLGGITGELYRQFAVTIGISVALSGFVALTLTPALCAILLKHNEKPLKPFILFNKGFNSFRNFFLAGVKLNLRFRWFAALTFIAACIGCWQFLEITPTSFVPREDQGVLRVAVQLPPAASLGRTGKYVEGLGEDIRKLPGVVSTTSLVANDTITNDTKSNTATMIVQLAHWNDRDVDSETVRHQVQDLLNESTVSVGQALNPPAIQGLGQSGGLDFYIQSRDTSDALVVQEVANDFIQHLMELPAVATARSMLQADAPQL